MKVNRSVLLEKKKELNCDYETFALKIGISKFTIWSLCNKDNYNSSLEILQKVADFCRIELRDLLSEESKKEHKLREW